MDWSKIMASTVYQHFIKSAENFTDFPFLYIVSDTADRYGISPGSISYGTANQEVNRLVSAYSAMGIEEGQRVAIGLDNRPECFYHWLALNALGISVVPLNPAWQSAELEYVLDHSEACLAIVLPDYLEGIGNAADNRGQCVVRTADSISGDHKIKVAGEASSECALLYTSGTTGMPKGCMLSNEYYVVAGEWYASIGGYCELKPGEDRLVTPLPMYHMNAMASSTMGMLMTGSCIVPLDRFHPSTWWESIQECDATIMHYLGVMPAMLMNMEPGPHDRAHNMRFGFGAGLSGELHSAFEERFNISLIEAWAMTETGCSVAVIASEEPRKVGTACFGKPADYIDYRLVDDEGKDVAQGDPGELLVRRSGDNPRQGFFSGYLKDSNTTAKAWADDYFHTGDLVYLDDDGLMHFVDRKKNVIRRSGENISAVEVEEVALEHPDVQAIGVTAVPDAIRGDEVFACVVTDNDITVLSQELITHCLHRLAYYKAPAYIAQVDALPLTTTEKIQRVSLKELAAELLAKGNCIDLRDRKVRQ